MNGTPSWRGCVPMGLRRFAGLRRSRMNGNPISLSFITKWVPCYCMYDVCKHIVVRVRALILSRLLESILPSCIYRSFFVTNLGLRLPWNATDHVRLQVKEEHGPVLVCHSWDRRFRDTDFWRKIEQSIFDFAALDTSSFILHMHSILFDKLRIKQWNTLRT